MRGLWAQGAGKSDVGGFIDISLNQMQTRRDAEAPSITIMSSAIQRETTSEPAVETLHEQQQLLAEGISVSLTHSPLDIPFIIASVKSPKAGAIVLFAGPPHFILPCT